jgi:hypothetical protein
VQNIEVQYMSHEGIFDEGHEIVVHVSDDINASSDNGSSTDTCDEADNGDETSGLPSISGIAPLSMGSDEDTWLSQNNLLLYICCCTFTNCLFIYEDSVKA